MYNICDPKEVERSVGVSDPIDSAIEDTVQNTVPEEEDVDNSKTATVLTRRPKSTRPKNLPQWLAGPNWAR